MAEPLKDRINRGVIIALGERFGAAHPAFDSAAFAARASRGLDSLELKERAQHVADALDGQLPADDRALTIFEAALGAELEGEQMGSLVHFIHSAWLTSRARSADFDAAMRAAEALTRRFTSEFAVRPLLERDPERAIAWLQAWSRSPNLHVRRLVSEGTRPRLPWAPRLTVFEGAYDPLIELLDALRSDPSLYVRRSVANHVGDLAKDDLALATDIAKRWMASPDEHTRWVVEHALRHPLKQGAPRALAIIGHVGDPRLQVKLTLNKHRASLGEVVDVRLKLANAHKAARRARADLSVDFPGKDGRPRMKVFRLPDVELAPAGERVLTHRLKLVMLSTRRLFAGRHRVALKLNGVEVADASFVLELD